MLIIGCLIVALVVFVIMAKLSDNYSGAEILGEVMSVMTAVVLFMCLVTVPLTRMGIMSDIAEIQAIISTAEVSRQSGDDTERFAYLQKIAEANQKIASWQYYRGTVFALWYPAEVEGLQPIQ